jgi:hypothetical protein
MRRNGRLGDGRRRLAMNLLTAPQTAVRNCGLLAVFIMIPGGNPASIISVAVIMAAVAIGTVAIQSALVRPKHEKDRQRELDVVAAC